MLVVVFHRWSERTLLQDENESAKRDHGQSAIQSCCAEVTALELLQASKHGRARCQHQNDDERQNEDDVIEHQVTSTGQVGSLVVQESYRAHIGPACAGELE